LFQLKSGRTSAPRLPQAVHVEARLDVRQPEIVGPPIPAGRHRDVAAVVAAIDQQTVDAYGSALRDLEQLILEKRLAHGNHPVLSMCAACAVVEGKGRCQPQAKQEQINGAHRRHDRARYGGG
jgi:hypothetical protein